MNIRQIKETCIYYRDLEKAKAFYNIALELPIISYAKGKYVFFRAGSSVLLCFNQDYSRLKKSPPAHYSEGKYHFAFEVLPKEYEKHKQKILSKGITIVDYVIWDTGQESFYFEDPEGNVLEIVPEGIWDQPQDGFQDGK